jgi:hypothetical protein
MQNQSVFTAAFPAKSLHDYKFWPHVARVDNVFGDRNPVCSCVGMEIILKRGDAEIKLLAANGF